MKNRADRLVIQLLEADTRQSHSFDVQLDMRPLSWSSDLERKVTGWANRKQFGVTWRYAEPNLNVRYLDGTPEQKEKATKTLFTLVRREKEFAATQRKMFGPA